jgi:DNA/RNA-binding domain of Phe-tRNA-synthetase-like protein
VFNPQSGVGPAPYRYEEIWPPMKKIVIEKEIFERFPTFMRGIIVVAGADNLSRNEKIERLLAQEIKSREGQNLIENKEVSEWDNVHRQFGSNPNKFPPSIKSLLKRISKGGEIPFINSAVALFNYISIKYLVPCGGDDTEKIEGNLRLGIAKGVETFVPLGETEQENPQAGEVIYFDDGTLHVMCRKWNWRNGDFTKITPETKKMIINIDGVAPMPRETIIAARDELMGLLSTHCRAVVTADLLDKNNPELDLPGFD